MLGSTIYVSNHASSFMDPLVVASMRPQIVFFLTRSDVFTPISKPFLWSAHMLPIYRQQDGVDTKDENQKTFDACAKVLNQGRNLLIFGEGFTDDVFIRRLKPVKKGAVRIGFNALVKLNWKKKVYIAAVGCNYSDPHVMRSDILIATSKKICLNDYRKEFEENPNKIISELTREVELMIREQITHVEDKNLLAFHENIMKLTRKGMNVHYSNKSIPLVKRWHYSQKLAGWLNGLSNHERSELEPLGDKMNAYFHSLDQQGINENNVYELIHHKKISRSREYLMLTLLFPFALLGLTHCGLPYFGVKNYVERSFKRPVFWGSVKLLLGMISMGLLNIPVIFLFYHFVYPSYWFAILYYFLIGLFGLAAYMWWRNFNRLREKNRILKSDLSAIISEREELLKEIKKSIPVA
jgi:1-acyl-sn-glycerol-3-phosphate acyltransferase